MYKITIHEVDENGNLIRDLETDKVELSGFTLLGTIEDGDDGWASGMTIMQHDSVGSLAAKLASEEHFLAAARKALVLHMFDAVKTVDVVRSEGADSSLGSAIEDALIDSLNEPEGGLQ